MTLRADGEREFWVFGYGSLMWRPGFAFDRVEPARLVGYHRAFCVYSTNHRGSDARPGLVLGLDRGGVCDGVAYRVPPEQVATTRRYLADREQINGIYLEKRVVVSLTQSATGIARGNAAAGSDRGSAAAPLTVLAQAYIVERAHPSYAGALPLSRQAHIIRTARGRSGHNLDYLINTLAELSRTGIQERELHRLGVMAGAVFGRPPCHPPLATAADGGRGREAAAHVGAERGPAQYGQHHVIVPVARSSVAALRNATWRRAGPAQTIPRWLRRRFVHRRTLAAW